MAMGKKELNELLAKNTIKVEKLVKFIPGGEALLADMNKQGARLQRVAPDNAKALKEIETVAKRAFNWINLGRENEVRDLVQAAHNTWLTGTLAGEYKKTIAFRNADAWLIGRAQGEDQNAWIQAGYEMLRGALKAPWGKCTKCGQKALMPQLLKGRMHVYPVCGSCNRQAKASLEDGVKNWEEAKSMAYTGKPHAKKTEKDPTAEELAAVDTSKIAGYGEMSPHLQFEAKVKAVRRARNEAAAAANAKKNADAKEKRHKPAETGKSKKGEHPKDAVEGKPDKGAKDGGKQTKGVGSEGTAPAPKPQAGSKGKGKSK